MYDTMRDRFWIWGQDPGTHHEANNNGYHLPGENIMTPVEGALYLGVPNCCRVVMQNRPYPPFDQHSLIMSPLRRVVWSIVGSGGSKRNDDGNSDIDEVVRQARMFPNVVGGVLDDFFNAEGARYSVDDLREFRRKLREESPRPLDLWVVWYEHQLDMAVREHLDVCDVITFWTWRARNLPMLEENIARVREATPGKRHLAGCYMWDYGDRQPMPMEAMRRQLDVYGQCLEDGRIDGVIFCSNCIADLGLDTVELTRQWIAEVGERSVSTSATDR